MTRRLPLALTLLVAVAVPALPPSPAAAQEHEETDDAQSDLEKAPPLARRLYKDLVCMCGGCQRESLEACKCAYARQEREKVLGLLAGMDTSTPAAQEKAYDAVVAAFIKEYGGEHVLSVPIAKGFNRVAWIAPYIIFALGAVLVVVLGRRWVRRGRSAEVAAEGAAAGAGAAGGAGVNKLSRAQREELEERLDDELREVD
jgi:cytochrome c-type biogenesis protein CcmH/NrfF